MFNFNVHFIYLKMLFIENIVNIFIGTANINHYYFRSLVNAKSLKNIMNPNYTVSKYTMNVKIILDSYKSKLM